MDFKLAVELWRDATHGKTECKMDRTFMLGRESQVYAYTGSIFPLGSSLFPDCISLFKTNVGHP
jgi:hypothetical protein